MTQPELVLIDPLRALRDKDYLLKQFQKITGREATRAEVEELVLRLQKTGEGKTDFGEIFCAALNRAVKRESEDPAERERLEGK